MSLPTSLKAASTHVQTSWPEGFGVPGGTLIAATVVLQVSNRSAFDADIHQS